MPSATHGPGSSVRGIVALLAAAAVSFTTLHAGPLPPTHHEDSLPGPLRSQPVVVYNRPYTGAIYTDYVPSADELAAPFATAMARGEYEPMQIGLYVPAGQPVLRDITLELTSPVPSEIGRIHYLTRGGLGWMANLLDSEGKAWHAPCDPKLLTGKRAHMPIHVLPVARIDYNAKWTA